MRRTIPSHVSVSEPKRGLAPSAALRAKPAPDTGEAALIFRNYHSNKSRSAKRAVKRALARFLNGL